MMALSLECGSFCFSIFFVQEGERMEMVDNGEIGLLDGEPLISTVWSRSNV